MSRDGGTITISGYHEDDTILLCTVIMKENCNYLLSMAITIAPHRYYRLHQRADQISCTAQLQGRRKLGKGGTLRSVFIKWPVLLNVLVLVFSKVSNKRPVQSQKNSIVLFYLCTCLLSLLNVLVWIF